jgi:hypothetical protein
MIGPRRRQRRPPVDEFTGTEFTDTEFAGTEFTDTATPPMGIDPAALEWDTGALFSPDDIHVGARYLTADGAHVAVLAVTGYPRNAYPGWLDPLLGYPGRVDVSLHIEPVDSHTAATRLRRNLARLESGRRHAADRGQLSDPDVDAAVEDAHELAARVARGEGRLYRVGLYLVVHADDEHALTEHVTAVRALAASLLLDARPASYRQLAGWTTCLPLGLDRLRTHRTMDTAAVAAAFPFTSPDLPAPDPVTPAVPGGVFYGFNLGSSGLVSWDRFTADNYNSVVLARSGAGKSYLIKLELLRSLYRGVYGIVIDPEGEYTRLTHAVGGTVLDLGAPGVHLNPLDLPTYRDQAGRLRAVANALTEAALFTHTALAVLLGEPDARQRAVLDHALTATYRRAGITDQPTTWGRPAPLLADLAATLRGTQDDTTQHHTTQHHTTQRGDTTSTSADGESGAGYGALGRELAGRLHPFTHGAYCGLLSGPTTTPPLGHHLVSFTLRRLPEQLRPIGALLVLDAIWRQVANPATRRPRLVVVDEAWMLLQLPAGAAFLARLARSARKYWAGLSVVTQDSADVLGTDLGRTIIANSATQILLRQSPQAIDQIAGTFGLARGEREFLLRASPGQGLLSTGARRVAFQAAASPAEHELITTNPRDLAPDTATTDPLLGEPGHGKPNHGEPDHGQARAGEPTGRAAAQVGGEVAGEVAEEESW